MFDIHITVWQIPNGHGTGWRGFGDTTGIRACLLEVCRSTTVGKAWQRAIIVYKSKAMLLIRRFV